MAGLDGEKGELGFSLFRVGMGLQLVALSSTVLFLRASGLTCSQSGVAGGYLASADSLFCLVLLVGIVQERRLRHLWIPSISWIVNVIAVGAAVH
jgi:hypothetical protein